MLHPKFRHIFSKSTAYKFGRCSNQILQRHLFIVLYYVEDCHEAIIEPETFDRVQEMIEQRSRVRHFSGTTIFSTKIRCGECGGWFGSKA